MDSYSKLKLTSEDNEDRISGLPDRVLSHILSFLPTKYAVLTSVLSSRWRHIWTSIHNFNFDSRHILNDDLYEGNDKMFETFVSRVMNCCIAENICSFRLACDKDQKISMALLHDWILIVADRNIEKLEVKLAENRGLQLPSNLLTCKSLVSLQLRLESAFDVPAVSDCFPSLKFLYISVMYPSAELAKKFFSSCPVLEHLSINCSSGEEVDLTFNITAPRLRTLEIDVYTDAAENPEYELVLNAPLLEYLHVQDQNVACCIKDPVPRLKKAILDLGDNDSVRIGFDYETPQLLHGHNLLGAVANTKYLSLSLQTTTVLHHGCHDGEIPCFPNLTTLKLEIYEFMVAKMLPKFLQGSPNLKVIILEMEIHDEDEANYKRPFKWMSSSVPAFYSHHLRVVKILSFSERPVEWNVIRHFLEKAKVLQKMIVYAGEIKRSEKKKISDRLSKLPRASEACVIKVL